METERALAKLRRLRYQSDYSLRLFLAAMGAICLTEGARPRREAPGPAWRLGWDRCPRCGQAQRTTRRRSV